MHRAGLAKPDGGERNMKPIKLSERWMHEALIVFQSFGVLLTRAEKVAVAIATY
jgi:hypothetical protein